MEERQKFNFFLVEGKGYKQQFSSELQSRREFGKLKKAGIQDEASFFVKLFGKNELTDDWLLLDEVQIKETYYER